MVKCFNYQSNVTDVCETDGYCSLLYKIRLDNVDFGSMRILSTAAVNITTKGGSQCITGGSLSTCPATDATDADQLISMYHTNQMTSTGDQLIWHLFSCCREDKCNTKENINITLCNRDPSVSCDTVTEWQNGTRPCFCSNTPVSTHSTAIDRRGMPKTEVMVNVLIAILVGIALCIIGTMVYFMVRNYFVRSRMRDSYRRNFQELAANGAGVGNQPHNQTNGEHHDQHELETEPLIAQPPKMKFDDFRYCFDGPNEKSLCGAGRYGAVHRVENKTTNKKYAMKIFRPSDNSKYIVQMWQKEYEHLTQVSRRAYPDMALFKRLSLNRDKRNSSSENRDYSRTCFFL